MDKARKAWRYDGGEGCDGMSYLRYGSSKRLDNAVEVCKVDCSQKRSVSAYTFVDTTRPT